MIKNVQSNLSSLPSARAHRRMLSEPGEPLFIAGWHDVLMIHFEVDPASLQRDVPFELDLWNGRAFVSLVAFTMRGMRPRFGGKWTTLLFRPIATHDFLNVRTYVRHGGDCGIHFLAEWLTSRLAVMLGPRTFGLPYRYGRISYHRDLEAGGFLGRVADPDSRTTLMFEARIAGCHRESLSQSFVPQLQRVHPHPGPLPQERENYRPTVFHDEQIVPFVKSISFQPCAAGSLDEWLMERYIAFNSANRNRRFFRVWHPPWPQCRAYATVTENSLLTNSWPWFKEARMVGGNFSPGFDAVWMGRPHGVP